MSRLKNPLEVYKLLPRSNCKGDKGLADRPHLGGDIIARFGGKIEKHVTLEEQEEEYAVRS